MRFQILVYLIVFVIGLAGGFYLALYLQNQIALLAAVAILFAFLTWLGSGAELLGLLREWYKERHETPKLSMEYDEKRMTSTFARELQLVGQDGKPTGITQKYLKVRVKNGGGVARNCKAELRLISWDKSTRAPSEDSKPLTWGDVLQKDIGARIGSELLDVVFSNSQFNSFPDNGIHALVSTKDSLYPQAPKFIRAQDGFGVGDFKVEITVTSEEGSFVKSTFRIHVDKDFRKLSMEKIS